MKVPYLPQGGKEGGPSGMPQGQAARAAALVRTEALLGAGAMRALARSRVAVFGIGGAGSYACEALVRSGIGAFDLIDNDTVCESNLNRQILATQATIGRYKTEVMKERMLEIFPDTCVRTYNRFFLPECANEFPFASYDYVVDAVDTVTAKIAIILKAKENGVPVISCMGAGNKLDGSRFRIADIYQTKVCPLARVMRRELKKRGIDRLKVVYSEEEPVAAGAWPEEGKRRPAPGSAAFVPSVAGLLLAGEVVKDLAKM